MKFTLSLLFLLSTQYILGQVDPNWKIFMRSYGPAYSSQQVAYNVMQTSTGEIVTVGLDRFLFGVDEDIMLMKFKANGDPIWSRSIYKTFDQSGYCVAETREGDYVIGGYKDGSLASRAAFITKTDSSGEHIWTQEISVTTTAGGIFDIIATSDSNIVCTGRVEGRIAIFKFDFNGKLIFQKKYNGCRKGNAIVEDKDGNFLVVGNNLLSNSAYILKLNSNGEKMWSKTIYLTGWHQGSDILITNDDKYLVLGTSNVSADGSSDVLVSKIDTSGNVLWANTYGSSKSELGYSFAQNMHGNIFILVNDYWRTMYIKLNSSGNMIWNKNMYAADFWITNPSTSIVSTNDNGLLISGYSTWSGAEHVALLKLDSTGYNPCVGQPGTYTSSPFTGIWSTTYLDTVYPNFSPAMIKVFQKSYLLNQIDSILCYEDFCQDKITYDTVSVTACDSFSSPSGNYTWTSNGTYKDKTLNAVGCDSLLTIHLTIKNSATGTDIQTACNSYTWIDGNTYTASNDTATFNIVGGAINGCDSLVTLDLTINAVSDLATTTSGATISAKNTAATYQWLDCDSSYAIILNETGQSFKASENGNYAVMLTENGCIDTSACVPITTIEVVEIIENELEDELIFYPNPTDGDFSIDLGTEYSSVHIKISNLYGKLIQSKSFNQMQILNLSIEEPAGIYLISFQTGGKNTVIKIIKE